MSGRQGGLFPKFHINKIHIPKAKLGTDPPCLPDIFKPKKYFLISFHK